MPNQTANFMLPYPNGDDDPCDFAAQWCDFTDAVNTVLDTIQETIDRTVPAIPAAGFKLSVPFVFSPLSGANPDVLFDTVYFDTAGWIDIDANNKKIVADRAMNSITIANMITQPDTLNGIWTLQINGGNINSNLDRNVAGQAIGTPGLYDFVDIITAERVMGIFAPSSGFTLSVGYMSLFWHADTERPS